MHYFFKQWYFDKIGKKWFERRKMLTPTFHFKILGDFVQVFNEQSQNLIQQLHDAIKLKNEIDVYPFITRCTLDIICGLFIIFVRIYLYITLLTITCFVQNMQIQRWVAMLMPKQKVTVNTSKPFTRNLFLHFLSPLK